MTNLDSILNSRDITLPTKIRLVKAMVFPVVMYGCVYILFSILNYGFVRCHVFPAVMYGCESWTVKKAER